MIFLQHCQSDVGGHELSGGWTIAKPLGAKVIHKPLLLQRPDALLHNILQGAGVGVQRCVWAKVSDKNFEVVPPVFSQTYVPVDWLEISNGDVR